MMRGLALALLLGCGTDPGDAVALTYPPDGWVVTSGTWGVDIDEHTTVRRSGARSIYFLDTTPAADPAMMSKEFTPIRGGSPYWGSSWVQADSVTAGDTVHYTVHLYDETFTETSTQGIHSGILFDVDEWVHVANYFDTDPGDRWAKFEIGKNNTAFKAFFDRVELLRMPPTAHVGRLSDQSISASTETDIEFDADDGENAGVEFDDATGTVTVPEDGFYRIDAGATLESVADQTRAYLRISVNGTPTQYIASACQYTGAGADFGLFGSTGVLLDAGDEVNIVVFHDDSVARNVKGGAGTGDQTYFRLQRTFP